MAKLFEGKVALVTGGSSGIGEAAALAFAMEGANVVIAARREKESRKVIDKIEKLGARGLFVKTDISKDDDVRNMVDSTVKNFCRLDFAFNNAGVLENSGNIVEKTEKDYNFVFDINVKGVFLSMKYEIPVMLKNGGGVIVNTSSVAGLIGMGDIPLYVASKHAVMGLTKSVAVEYAKSGIRVNSVNPGAIKTAMVNEFIAGNKANEEALISLHPIGRLGVPEEIASAVIWLCSPGASFVTGQAITIDGGWTAQ